MMKIDDMLSQYKYRIVFYIPYRLYVLCKESRDIKSIVKQEVDKNIPGKHSKSIQVKKIAEDFFLITIKVKEDAVYQQIKEMLANDKELLPPWTAFPDIFQGCPRWNQGYEEDYCCNHWIPYWKNLSEKEKDTYCVKHKAPQEWLDWLSTSGL